MILIESTVQKCTVLFIPKKGCEKMAHLHSVYDTDSHFSVDPITRQITNLSSKKNILIQGDHNSERFTFQIPRTIEGHDMSTCNVVQVHYTNIDAKDSKNMIADVYEPTDFKISPDGEDVVIFSWLISANATKYVGSLNFCLRLACATGSEMDYVWVTAVHSGITVAESIDNAPAVVDQYSDVLQQWYMELIAAENRGVNAVKAAEEEAIENIDAKQDEIFADIGRALDSIIAIQSELMGLETIRFAEDLGEENLDFTVVLDGEKTLSRAECIGNVFCAKSVLVASSGTLFFHGITSSGEEFIIQVDGRFTIELTEGVTITKVTDEIDVPGGQYTITFPDQVSYPKVDVCFDDSTELQGISTLLGTTQNATKVKFDVSNYGASVEYDIYGTTASGESVFWRIYGSETKYLTESITITDVMLH